jgi:hypothetical protein
VGARGRSNDTIAAQFLMMRGPHGCHLFASLGMASPNEMLVGSY